MKLNNKKTFFVGFAFLLICMFWQVYDNVIAKVLINSFGLNQTWSGVVMALDNILAIILLPVFGALSDKTNTKYGKRTPYIFWGTVVAAILIVGVAFFDNAQMAKVKDANISDVVTIEIGKEGANGKTYEAGSYSIITEQETKNVEYQDGDKLYVFTYEETKYYETKELATDARSVYVSQIRNDNIGYCIGFLGILFLVLIAMATFRTPAVSLMPDVTPKPLRSKANAIINLMGAAGGIIALGFMTFLAKDYQSYIGTFACLGGLMIACLIVFILTVKEPKMVEEMHEQELEYGIEEVVENNTQSTSDMTKDVRKSFLLILASIIFWFMAYNAATSKFSVYASTVLDTGFTIPLLIAQAAAIICYIPIGILSSKFGRKRIILVGIIILFSAFLLGCFLNEKSAMLVWVVMALAGIGWASINVNSYPMVVEMSKNSNIGKYTGIYYTASMAAQIATPVLSGLVMDMFGTMKVLFPYCVVFCILALITMTFVKHGDSKPIPSKKLEAFESMED